MLEVEGGGFPVLGTVRYSQERASTLQPQNIGQQVTGSKLKADRHCGITLLCRRLVPC